MSTHLNLMRHSFILFIYIGYLCLYTSQILLAQPVQMFPFHELHYGMRWRSHDALVWLSLEKVAKEDGWLQAYEYNIESHKFTKKQEIHWKGVGWTPAGIRTTVHSISPKGQYILTLQNQSDKCWWQVDGLGKTVVKRVPPTQQTRCGAWLPDDSGWLDIVPGDDHIEVQSFSLKDDAEVRHFSLSGLHFDGEAVGITDDQKLVLWGKAELVNKGKIQYDRTTDFLIIADMKAREKPWRRYRVGLPADHEVYGIELSRQGDLVWTLVSDSPPRCPLLFRDKPVQSEKDGKWISYLVSKSDGSQIRAVGCFFVPADNEEYGNIGAKQYWRAFWMPDNKHITFVTKGSLWKLKLPSK